jgi:hypothetical protein
MSLTATLKREVMLRDALETLWVGTNRDEWDGVAIKMFEDALAATADLDGLIVCEAEEIAWVMDVEYCLKPGDAFSWVETQGHNLPLYRAWEPK